jgi:predicted site-specific integrase-resolvase
MLQTVKTKIGPEKAKKIVGCDYGTLMRYVRNGMLPHFHIGRKVYFFEESLYEWMEELEKQSVTA